MAETNHNMMNALCTVSLHADSVWWHEAKDKYRLANLNLWVNVLRTQSQPPGANYEYYDDKVTATSRCLRKALEEVDLPEEMTPDPEAWLKGHSWPTAIVRNFPAISIALVGELSFYRGLELLSEKNLPYKVETSEEAKLYRRTCCESVKNIWSDPKFDNVKSIPRRESASLVVPKRTDFNPSVLRVRRPSNPQPTYPTITDHSYQSDLFPYKENNVEQERKKRHINNNTGQQNPATAYPRQLEESRGGQGSMCNNVAPQKATAKGVAVTGNQRMQRPKEPHQESQQQPHQEPEQPEQHLLPPYKRSKQPQTPLYQLPPYKRSQQPHQQSQSSYQHPQLSQQPYQQPQHPYQQPHQSYQQSQPSQQSYQQPQLSQQPQQPYQQSQQSYQQPLHPQQPYQQPQQSYQQPQVPYKQPHQSFQQPQHPQQPYQQAQLSQESYQQPHSLQQPYQQAQQPYLQSVHISQQKYHSQPILHSSDFPELPHRGNEHTLYPVQTRRPFLPDPGIFTEGRGSEIPEVQSWLQGVYPQRVTDFSSMASLASKFEEFSRRVNGCHNQEVQATQTDVHQLPEQGLYCLEGRRLYRDVLAPKALDEDSETNVKFDELEREAIEQYLESQDEIDEMPGVELSADLEEKFLDLERQAIEQYEGQECEFEEQPITKEPEARSPYFEKLRDTLPLPEDLEHALPSQEVQKSENIDLLPKGTLAQQKTTDWFQEQPHSSTWSPRIAQEVSEEPSFRDPETPRSRCVKEEEAKPVEAKRRGRKEPAPTPSCVRLPYPGPSQEPMSPSRSVKISERCEKRYGARASKSSRANTPYQERSSKKGQDSFRKSYYKKKEPSPKTRFLQNKKRPPPLSVVDREVRSLVNCLKARTLNFLKDADTRTLMEEHSKDAVRELLYKKQPKESIRKEVKIVDIQDTDTLRLYAREISGLARQQMQAILKRVRDDVIDMISRKTIFIAQPTTAEKRKVRYYIKKCLELMEKAESLKKMPKKPLESSKKEITDTLATIHKTMDVVYLLRDMCRETYEDMEYLKSSKETVVEILLGRSYLEDKSDYIRQRVEKEKLSLLLYCLFPKRESVLFDREWAKLSSRAQSVYMFYDQQLLNNTLLINHQPIQWATGLKQVRFVNWMTATRPRRKELWSEDIWEKCLIIGCHSRPVDVFVEWPRSVLVPVFRREPVQESQPDPKMGPEPKINPEEKIEAPLYIVKPPRKRKAGTKSDSELFTKQPTLASERSYWTWPKTYKTSNLLRLLKAQPKQRKKPAVKNDSGCSLM